MLAGCMTHHVLHWMLSISEGSRLKQNWTKERKGGSGFLISEILLRDRSESSIYSELFGVHQEIQEEAMFRMNRACEMMSKVRVKHRFTSGEGVEHICMACDGEVEDLVDPNKEDLK